MNKNQFYEYLLEPEQLDAADQAQLKELVDAYPFFQAARLLHVKALYNAESARFNEELRIAAAHCSNRAKLFQLVVGGESMPKEGQQEAFDQIAVDEKKKLSTNENILMLDKTMLGMVDQVKMKGRELWKLIQPKQLNWI